MQESELLLVFYTPLIFTHIELNQHRDIKGSVRSKRTIIDHI
jgi:hypothetical protein